MSYDVAKLARSLAQAIAVDEYIVSEVRSRETFESLDKRGSGRSEALLHTLEAQLFVDRQRGRGRASLAPVAGRPLTSQIQEASTRAFEALGPGWKLPPAAAPARVPVHDASEGRTPRDIARAVLDEFRKALGTVMRPLEANARVSHGKHRTILSNGFDNQYLSTDIALDAVVQSDGGVAVPLRLRSRRLANLDLALQEAVERARQRSLQDAKAKPVEARLVDLVLVHSAYLPNAADDFGIWTPLVQQAEAGRVRAGISTHNPGQPLLESPSQGDPLELRSEGTEPYAMRCAPFSFDGQATRNFSLAANGLATGVAISHRDAALGAGTANGGVRRLVIAGGSLSLEQAGRPESRPLLFVQALGALETTKAGDLFMDVTSAEMRTRDGLGRAIQTPVRSALLVGNLRTWLGSMLMSRDTTDDSWLHGPSLIRVNNVRIQ